MALTRAKKTLKVEALAKELAGSTSAIVGTFTKLTVSQDFALRQKVREAGGRYRVLKNKLAARASLGTGIEGALQGLKGVSSVAYTSGDPVALAKALSAWVKDNAEFTFKLGIVEGKVITVEEVQSLATMPGKDEIFAKLLFLISAPAQRLVTVVSAASRDLAVVINQGVEKGRFAESAPAPAAPAAATEVKQAQEVKEVQTDAAPAVSPETVLASEAAAATPVATVEAAAVEVPVLEAAPLAAAVELPEASPALEREAAGAPEAAVHVEMGAEVETAPVAGAAAETATPQPVEAIAQAPAPAAAEASPAEMAPAPGKEAAAQLPAEG